MYTTRALSRVLLVVGRQPCRGLGRRSPSSGRTGAPRAVVVRNEQSDVDIDHTLLGKQAEDLLNILKVADYSLTITLCTEEAMKEYHKQCLVTYESTDIISLRTQKFSAPEVFSSKFKISRKLGDIIICPAYVHGIFLADKEELESGVYEEDLEDAGVSRAMTAATGTKDRISLLLVHGLLHVLGHDHETTADWKLMTAREEEVLEQFTSLPSWTGQNS